MISVITCSVDQNKFNGMFTVYHEYMGEPMEVIRISDAKSLSEGYNRGIKLAKGDVLIFSHDDAGTIQHNLGPKLRDHFNHVDIVGGAGSQRLDGAVWFTAGIPYVHGQVLNFQKTGVSHLAIFGTKAPLVADIQALDGFFMATTKAVAEANPFDERFDGFHLYDVDWSFSAYQKGLKIGVANDLFLTHASGGGYNDPPFLKQMYKFIHKWGHKINDPIRRDFVLASTKVQGIEEARVVMASVVGQPIF